MPKNPKNLLLRAIDVQAGDQDMTVTGYAAVFDSPTVLWTDEDGTEYKEVMERGCLDHTDLSNVVLRYNHNDGALVLARTSNGTLKVTPDAHGLRIEATLAPTSQGKDLYTLIKRGDVNKMSFGGYAGEVEWDAQTNTRHIKSMDSIFDVSAVDFPAYDQTSLAAIQRDCAKAQENEQNIIKERLRIEISGLF